MKKIKFLYIVGVLSTFVSCKKFLDINENPNSATEMIPELILPSALTRTASMMVTYNDFGAWMVGYATNAGGYGGWGNALTYDYTTTSHTGQWETTYDILSDYQQIINLTEGSDQYANYNGVAKIMKAFHFQYLVDNYNDVPYSQALLDVKNVSPSYDNAKDVYRAISDLLDEGIAVIKNASLPQNLMTNSRVQDIFFRSDMQRWIQFANTVKLRLYVRASQTDVFASKPFTSTPEGFIQQDVLANPGYQKVAGQQSPFWNAYHSTASDGGSARSWITSYYALSFYNGTFMLDSARATAVYRDRFTPARNQLGVISGNPAAPGGSSVWYSGNGVTFNFGQNLDSAAGVLKGPSQSSPVFTAAESYLLQAEAAVRGIITDDYVALFNQGISQSFHYLFKSQNGDYKKNRVFSLLIPDGNVTPANVDALVERYHTVQNPTNYLVNIDLATSTEERIEAIITQKYVALNMINGFEAWAEYRRTGYPKITGTTRELTFISTNSSATTPDRALGRLLYPATEYQLNSLNVPANITVFGSYVFWDRRNN